MGGLFIQESTTDVFVNCFDMILSCVAPGEVWRLQRNVTVLELGCGNGQVPRQLQGTDCGASVTGPTQSAAEHEASHWPRRHEESRSGIEPNS